MTELSSSDLQLLFEWNVDYPRSIESCVHTVFKEQVALRPDAIAVCAWDDDFSYKELDQLANVLAEHLVSLGVGPEVLVPFCFAKSAWTVVSMMAILKSGGACVAIDPSDPLSRSSDILAAIDATLLLAAPQYVAKFEQTIPRVVPVDASTITAMTYNGLDLVCPPVRPENVAFVIFTSGSTGKPKGVVLSHAAVCTSAEASGVAKGIDHNSRILQFSNYTFDGSIQDHFFALMRGGVVCVPSEEDRMDDLAGAINRMEVNWLFLTPSVVALLKPSDVPTVKILTLGGEALTAENIQTWAGKVRVMNTYGPAENTVGCAVHEYTNTDDNPRTIGRPIGTLAWVTNIHSHDELAPIGQIGELLVEGPMLARCYLGDPETTTKSFIEDPLWLPRKEAGKVRRLYKTGDLVSYNRDGTLNFVGRKDSQIKFRGQRVELGEIEHILQGMAEIDKTMVIAPKVGRLSEYIVALFSLRDDDLSCGSSDSFNILPRNVRTAVHARLDYVRERLSQIFPSYINSLIFVPLTCLPLTSSGKIDRVKVRNWVQNLDATTHRDIISSSDQGTQTTLSTPTEHQLQRLWSQLLRISIDDIEQKSSFLRLGGDSLAAMKLAAACRDHGFSLQVADVLRYPELHSMAQAVSFATPEVEKVPTLSAPGDQIPNIEEVIAHISQQYKICPEMIEDVYQATAIQESLVSLSARDSNAYISEDVYELPDHLDRNVLRAACRTVTKKNAILRTRIAHSRQYGTLQAVIRDDFVWQEYSSFGQYLNRDKLDTMEIGKPMLRFTLAGNRLVMKCHHAIYDGWSKPFIMRDVQEVYRTGRVAPRTPYTRFVKYLSSRTWEDSKRFWEKQLHDAPVLKFPATRSSSYRPVANTTIEHHVELSRRMRSNITTATLARAAWALINMRYLDSNDVVFGAIVSGRYVPVDGIDEMIGPTIGTVPIRVRANDDMLVNVFLQQIQNQSIEMIAHEHYGLQRIMSLGADLRSACDFNNCFVVHPELQTTEDEDSMLVVENQGNDYADYRTYPLNVACTLKAHGLNVHARFDDHVIDHDQAERVVNLYESILQRLILEEPSMTLRDATEITIKDQEQLMNWNKERPKRVDHCVHELIEINVKKKPLSEAVCSWDGSLTYLELDRLSSRLAHHLVAQGVGPETYVPFCFEKSMWTIVAIMGIMKAGGASVPLDTTYPKSRMQFIVKAINAKLLVTSTQQYDAVKDLATTVVIINRSTVEQMEEADSPACSIIRPSNAVYVIYTSGSTGLPKGVVWEHSSLSTSSIEIGRAQNLGAESRVLQFASYIWDQSVFEMIVPLIQGGCICIPSESDRFTNLPESVNKMKVTWAFFTPTFARSLKPEDFPSLRTVILGGESIGEDNVERWSANKQLFSGYGPSETCMCVAVAEFTDKTVRSGNIGRAYGARIWITEKANPDRLVPIGAIGEILIEGPGVGRGYINDPEKTGASFIINPTWARNQHAYQRSQSRFYRTGDLAKLNSDRSITFIGRADTQVKVRGQRLELGEIEHGIARCSIVRHAVVMFLNEGPLSGRLLTVFSLETGRPCQSTTELTLLKNSLDVRTAITQIKESLIGFLPSFAVPDIWIAVEDLPQTTSGKLDRNTIKHWLSDMTQERASDIQTLQNPSVIEAPQSYNEKQLQQTWSEILKLPEAQIGRDSNFLQLGGDSIRAMTFVEAMKQKGFALSVLDIFEHPRLSDLAEILKAVEQAVGTRIPAFALLSPQIDHHSIRKTAATQCGSQPDDIEDIYPATPLQEAMLALTIQFSGTYIARTTYKLPLTLDQRAFREAWQTVVQQNPILRTRLVNFEGHTMQVVLNHEFQYTEGRDLEAYLAFDRNEAMQFGKRLVRFAVVNNTFVMSIHHALYDAWALQHMFSELRDAYKSAQKATVHRPSFNSFIHFQQGLERSACQKYWESYLKGSDVVPFPPHKLADYHPTVDDSVEKTCAFTRTDSSITTALLARAAWGIVVARFSGSTDITFGVTISGRDAPVDGIMKMMGPTINTVPVRVNTTRGQSVKTFLRLLQNEATEMIPFQHFGLQNIRRVSVDAERACNFQHSLVVYPNATEKDGLQELGVEKLGDNFRTFRTYAIAIDLLLLPQGGTTRLYYDSKIVSGQYALRLVRSFEQVLLQLVTEADRTEATNGV